MTAPRRPRVTAPMAAKRGQGRAQGSWLAQSSPSRLCQIAANRALGGIELADDQVLDVGL